MAGKIVVDTSVFIKWIKTKDEDLIGESRALLREIERRSLDVHVPALLLYEIGNVLLTRTRLGLAALELSLDRIEALPFRVAPPAGLLLRRAAQIGRRFGVTFYDASFVALAAEMDCAFVTADRRLYDKVRALPRIRHLSRVGDLL
jgi:predicted nucleic acid-binding protein